MEDDLAILIRIIKGITFNRIITLLGIYPMHGGINIYLCTDMKDLQYISLSKKKIRGKTKYKGILSCIKYIRKNTQKLNLRKGTEWLKDTDGK